MASRFALPHIEITRFKSQQDYSGVGGGGSSAVRIREEHGRRLQAELDAAFKLAEKLRPKDDRLSAPTTSIIEVELRRGADPETLDRKKADIRSSAAKANDRDDRTVAVFVPDGSKEVLAKILDDYLNGPLSEEGKNPPNKRMVEAIEAFRAARLETVWTDDPAALPTDPQHQMWWALWCWPEAETKIEEACERLKVRAANKDRRLYFPDVTVIPVLAPRAAIELTLFLTGAIAELRRATDNPTFFLDEVRGEQHPWSDDLAGRIQWPGKNAPAVCVFDTGVNRGHALIEPALAVADLHTLDADWGVDDQHEDGHGTSMAGMVLHGDLTAALGDASERQLKHRVESVKLLPPDGFDENEPASYGVLTQAAIALPEIAAPARPRVFCMAATNLDVSGATPSSWSAAIDQAASGSMIGDEENAPKRLIVVAAGNISAEIDAAKIQPQDTYPIEDPAQAWNALTIGGYTDLVDVRDKGYEDWSPMAVAGDLSPHSRTSETWPQGKAPFKPEVVMEAGNRAYNPKHTEALTFGSLSLLSTGSNTTRAPLVPFQATSAASAQGARLAARVAADHPEYWPETLRGLIVHSAEWTQPMLDAFDGTDGKKENYALVRRFGYGVPDYDRATASANNHLALFAQADIQPFKLDGQRKFNECHYYTLPIPADLLERLENETVALKITLSYFVEPNPGLSANVVPQRYQSYGLRFDLRRKGESLDTFKKRVNAAEREDPKKGPRVEADDNRWLLGPDSISAGSIHCDVWSGPAIELLGRDTLCIKPVNGWWRDRAGKEYVNKKARYALIVTLKAANVDVDLYTPIKTVVDIPAAEIETPI
ncbi:S8 family peptidase [Bradyrhizobium sp. BRP56]|uniref:S8 family peptidase n=1 Tax=Bradyrhizobium sp. BRP56 TaxID=2793819 RepID=UPI001CD45CB0|nr:S8 family peptidase [Bradyrhizobium sp. BRP56]MCA1401486.1 S8 family serine peptidase [Bradyrhizobium sp. BRP56]